MIATSNKLRSVLLVDDNEADNFLHRRVINGADAAEQIHVCRDGRAALDYLTTPIEGDFPTPDLIFLDINMPRMNGWEFLDEYRALPVTQRGRVVVVMLTTSDNPADLDRAMGYEVVDGYRTKPLDAAMLVEIMREFFPGLGN